MTVTRYWNTIRCCFKALLVCHIATSLGQLAYNFIVHLLLFPCSFLLMCCFSSFNTLGCVCPVPLFFLV
ncbi:hypothetical protein PAHAL_3G426600 [Panicum hallii]|uniref:Uncharacterized protein n=1 Tax=Panicum hallii TaxID=206008 RepID=A0A2S3HEB4_9POAL|nr:hypothetical protein PAHAL_3G426600 [Panicum hallii]